MVTVIVVSNNILGIFNKPPSQYYS